MQSHFKDLPSTIALNLLAFQIIKAAIAGPTQSAASNAASSAASANGPAGHLHHLRGRSPSEGQGLAGQTDTFASFANWERSLWKVWWLIVVDRTVPNFRHD